MKITRFLGALAVVATVLLASCGSSGSSSDKPTTTPATTAAGGGSSTGGGAGGAGAVKIVNFKFDPTPIEVKAGTTVKFTNEDGDTHTATSTGDVPKDFDTGDLEKGDSKEITFDKAGKYTYQCSIHNYMKGAIDVK